MALFYRGLPGPLDLESRLVAGAFLVDVEVRRNVGEHAAQRVLQGAQAGDDADADDGGDQAGLDRGGAGLVLHKASKNGVHGTLPFEVNCYYPFTGRHQCLRRLNNCKPTDGELISS